MARPHLSLPQQLEKQYLSHLGLRLQLSSRATCEVWVAIVPRSGAADTGLSEPQAARTGL